MWQRILKKIKDSYIHQLLSSSDEAPRVMDSLGILSDSSRHNTDY